MVYRHADSVKYRKSQIVLSVLLSIVLVTILALAYFTWDVFESDQLPKQIIEKVEEIVEKPVADDTEMPEPEPEFDSKALQTALDGWVTNSGGISGVVLMNIGGEVLASHNADRPFFTASIYKLFVAYEGYKRVDSGEFVLSSNYLGSRSLGDCLDLMIRESDSPCAEKLWVELGKSALNGTLERAGITNTDMVGLTATAKDAATQLKLIASGEGISVESKTKLMTSMRDQIYRDTLNKSFDSSVVVYNKIGFRELVEYHDTEIIEFSDGRSLIMSVLTENVGTRNIIALGDAIEAAVTIE